MTNQPNQPKTLPKWLRRLPSDPGMSICSRWRELFGSRLAAWPSDSVAAPGAGWAAILSRVPLGEG